MWSFGYKFYYYVLCLPADRLQYFRKNGAKFRGVAKSPVQAFWHLINIHNRSRILYLKLFLFLLPNIAFTLSQQSFTVYSYILSPYFQRILVLSIAMSTSSFPSCFLFEEVQYSLHGGNKIHAAYMPVWLCIGKWNHL